MERIEIEYRRSLTDGICRAGFLDNGGLIPEEEFMEEFRKSYAENEFKPEIRIFYGGISQEEAFNFRRRLERI